VKRLIVLVVGTALLLTGCGSKETEKVTSSKVSKASPKWVKLESGLEYRDLVVGTGPEAKDGDLVTADYKGWLDNGSVFDSSKRPGCSPIGFKLGSGAVITGWDQGIKGMKAGGKRELKIPPKLAYGDMEQPGIPADSTLYFEVELLKIGQ